MHFAQNIVLNIRGLSQTRCNDKCEVRLIGFQASIFDNEPRRPQGLEALNEVKERHRLMMRWPL